MLSASAQAGVDWSAAYRLFERERFDKDALFAPARRSACSRLQENDPLVVLMDDTLVRKRGQRVFGAAWKRDPLGPPFCNNFVWGQRFLQLSAALPEGNGPHRSRGIPIDLTHCPLPKKPWRTAPLSVWEEYHGLKKTMKISAVGVDRIKALRASMDTDSDHIRRPLILAVDGSFTNKTVFRDLPPNTTVVDRIRKDARLFLPPTPSDRPRRGRRRWYGDLLPMPEQFRQDPAIPWLTVPAWGAGQIRCFEVKTLSPARWAGSGGKDVRLVVIRPLA